MGEKQNPLARILDGLLEGSKGGLVLNVLIAVLMIAALLLPPVSAQERIFEAGYVPIDRDEGGSVSDADGMQVSLLPEGMSADVKLKEESVPRAGFVDGYAGKELKEAAQVVPSHLYIKSPIYQLGIKGDMPSEVFISVPIPNEAEPYETLSLYEWTGAEWQFVPSTIVVEDDVLEAQLDYVPETLAAFQSTGHPPQVSAELPEYVSLPDLGGQALTELNPLGYYLGSENDVVGQLPSLPVPEGQESYRVLPTLRNWTDDGVVRSDLVDNMLVIPENQAAHAQAIVDVVVREMYAGIDLDYRGINSDLRADYTAFVRQLAEGLRANGKRLTIHVEAPVQVAEDRWETGAYDWKALGGIADGFKFPAIQDPSAYALGGQMEALLWWAVGQVERYKLQPVFSARSVENSGGVLVERTYRDALAELSKVALKQGDEMLVPGEQVTVGLDSAGVQLDPATGRYWFAYVDQASGQQRTVYLEDASSLSRKLELLSRFSLGGVAVRAMWDEGNDPRIWELVREYQSSAQASVSPVDSNFAVVWSVEGQAGYLAEQTTGLEQKDYTWAAPDQPGAYEIGAAIVANDGQTVAGSSRVAVLVEEPTSTPTPTPSPTPVPTDTPVPTPTATPPPTATPKPTARPAASSSSSSSSSSPPPASSSAPNPGFGYGIQIDPNDDLNWVSGAIKGMGFGWVKFQAPWKDYEGSKGAINWGDLDNKVNALSGSGLKVMLSIVKAPAWARGGQDMGVEGPPNNPQDFADFLGAVAGRYCSSGVKAIEVWNEQNLHYEWGNKPINAADYMALLKPAYNKIKAACPSMIVISGALTPTGAPAPKAMDDFAYLEKMYQNGLKQYSDAIGAHPSGYNVAPHIGGGQPACDFIAQQGSSFRGPCNTLHHSWSFNRTLNGYYEIMKKYGDGKKKIWPTEFGWATDWIGDPSYGYAADNTRAEQAEWTVQSYKLMKQWGFVGVAFLWNLNFKVTANGNECSQWGIMNPNRTPTETYNRLAGMPK